MPKLQVLELSLVSTKKVVFSATIGRITMIAIIKPGRILYHFKTEYGGQIISLLQLLQ